MHTGQNSIAPESSLPQLGQVRWDSVLMGLTVLQPQSEPKATARSNDWCESAGTALGKLLSHCTSNCVCLYTILARQTRLGTKFLPLVSCGVPVLITSFGDGLATIDSGHANLWSRNGLRLDSKYPLIVQELEGLKLKSAILDGEIVALDAERIPRFGLLQRFQRDRSGTLMYLVFDLLYLNKEDLMGLPLLRRREILKKLCQH
jgi:hypothetical protein